jgi:hypothetical protein
MSKKIAAVITLALSGLAFSCAFDVIRVKQEPAELRTCTSNQDDWILAEDVKVTLDTGYSRKLKAGTRWQCIGEIEQGEVYHTDDQILTVEGSNIYEASIVVANGQLVGFYLPANRTFSPLASKKLLPIDR